MLFLNAEAKASPYEVEYNLLTEHLLTSCEVAESFNNKFADCGRAITNPIISIKDTESGERLFIGENSIGEPMLGYSVTNHSIIIGAYLEQRSAFKRKGLLKQGFSWSIYDVNANLIVGAEFDTYLQDYKAFTIITPALILLGVGFRF